MMPFAGAMPRTKATNLDRFIGGFIDGIILAPIYFVLGFALVFMPILAGLVTGLIGAAWWLFRDAKGLSIGKKVMNLEVISKDGSPATQDQLMKRNFTLAGGSALSGIPVIGLLGSAIILIEGILVLAKGERYGDTMANTMVVKKG